MKPASAEDEATDHAPSTTGPEGSPIIPLPKLQSREENSLPTTKNAVPVTTMPSRRRFLQASLASGAGAAMLPALAGAREFDASASASAEVRRSELDELTVSDLQGGMQS